MAHETYPISPIEGPLLAVKVSPAGKATPPLQVTALVDTGSNVTCVSARVIHLLGLLPRPDITGTTTTAGGSAAVSMYDIDLLLMDLSGGVLKGFQDLPVMGLPYPLDAVETLIGRDILESMRFHYDGPAACFTLSD